MPQNIWFTADEHYSHEKIRSLASRPFANTDEMDEALVANFNARVGRQDLTYHVGDFCWKRKEGQAILRRLNGHHVLILGNHDDESRKLNGWMEVTPYKEIRIGEQTICLFHYACLVFNKSYRGAIQLFGHSHGRLPGNSQQTDVGVDAWNYRPVTLDEIRQRLNASPPFRQEDNLGDA